MLHSRLTGPVAALALAAVLSPSAAAHDSVGSRPQLDVGMLLGGENLFLHARTSVINGFVGLFLGIDGTPTVPGGIFQPVYGMNLGTAALLVLPTDGTGRMLIDVPTAPGTYGPTAQDIPLFFQVLATMPSGFRGVSPVTAVTVEPGPVFPGYLTDVSATNLPAGFDTAAGANLVTGDVNRDGHTDLVFIGGDFGDELFVWTNDGTGVFTDATSTHFPSYLPQPVGTMTMVDVDGDNHLDLLMAGGFDVSVAIPDTLWRNNGFGVFTVDPTFPTGDGLSRSFETGDFNGDGHLDIVVGVGPSTHLPMPGGEDRLYLADGIGGYTESLAFEAAPWNDPDFSSQVMRSGDVDNDGDLDLMIGRQDLSAIDGQVGQPNLLLLNDGAGNFTDFSAVLFGTQPSDNTQDIALADLDLDGDLDIVVANTHASVSAALSGDLYWNQGGIQGGSVGFFVEDTTSDLEISTPADWVRLNVEVEDMDGDGTPDILMGVHDLFIGADQLLFTNQGGAQGGTLGTFTREFWFDPGDFICYGIAGFDMDHDGDRDLVLFASGVVAGDPAQGLRTRLLENTIH